MTFKHETRLFLLALGAGALPAAVACGLLLGVPGLQHGQLPPTRPYLLAVAMVVSCLGAALAARALVVASLRRIAGVLSALREEDFSVRLPPARPDDAFGEVARELNLLGEMLREQRLGVIEASALLRKVVSEIDLAVLAFDADARLRLSNPAAERLLGKPAPQILGLRAVDLGLEACLEGSVPRTLATGFPGGAGPFELRRTTFRERGLPNVLVVLTDLRRALREEERQAWQSLVRVLGHEINNSLAPIQSLAQNLQELLARRVTSPGGGAEGAAAPSLAPPLAAQDPEEINEDLAAGLAIIERRSAALARFLAGYAKLARLPPPTFAPVDVTAWVQRTVALEPRAAIQVVTGPNVRVAGDADQLDQLLINLLRNAVDAAGETGGQVTISWQASATSVDLRVTDEGPGLCTTSNLFVPFFTTKPEGSGIGLVLSRQIAEAHGGSLTLGNRPTAPGAEAHLRLPR